MYFMKNILIAIFIFTALGLKGQTLQSTPKALDKQDLWTKKDLIEPANLAAILTNKKSDRPVIFNIGVVEDIAGAKNIGAASKTESLNLLKDNLRNLPKNSFIVIYCGCCPFDKCPNIRPAFNLMKSMGFTNGRLLNIPVNLKQNWINKGYPLQASATAKQG